MTWETVLLGELVQAVSGRAGGQHLPVYSVTKHSGFVPSREYFKKQVFSTDLTTYKIVDPGQFAYATIHLDEGSIGIAPERCVISPMYTVFSADPTRVHGPYLLRYLKSPVGLSEYPRLGRGTAERRKSISLDALGRIQLVLPPLAEQRRIAAILDEADALIKMARTRRNSLDDAEDSLFAVTLGDTVGLERRTLADFAREFRYGTSEKSGPSGVPVLRIPNLTGRVVDTTDLKTVSLSPAELSRLELSDQDVLFVRSNGNPNVVGRAGAFASVPPAQRDGATWVFASYLIRSRLAEGVSARAVVALTRSPIAKRHFRAAASTSAGQYNISIPVLRALPMFDPTSERTTEFERGMDHIERLRTSARRAERFNHELFASLQHRAFRGEL